MVSLLENTNQTYQPTYVLLVYLQQIDTKETPYSLDRSYHLGMSYSTTKIVTIFIQKRLRMVVTPEKHLARVYKHESNFSSESAHEQKTERTISLSISNQMK